MYVRNVNIPFKKDFKFAKIPKHPFSFRYRPENSEGNEDVESICGKVTKHAS